MVLKRTRAAALLAALAVSFDAVAAHVHHYATAPRPSQAPPDIKEYAVTAESGDSLRLAPPVLPDLSPYTSAAVAHMIPAGPKGHAEMKRMVDVETLHEFVGGRSARLAEWAARQSTMPRVILVEGGVVTPHELAHELSPDQFAETSPGVFLLRVPLLVTQGATLHIDASTKEFRLSQDGGAFLSNDGLLFITGTKVTSWNERTRRSATFQRPEEFRPFIASFGGSRLYIADSTITSLGYSASKSYGISISQYSPNLDARLRRTRPTGWILNSTFVDNWFGFYCYEANDVAIIGNTYRDNIFYGIDPHDSSRRLIIAGNTVTGSKEKHGLIISRDVTDSWIIGNRLIGNRLSGIVLDRSSSNNVVAYNDMFRNGSDGLTIYESPKNLLWGNRSVGNARHGFRMRNSVDIRLYDNIALGNGRTGIYGHIKDLTGTDRDMRLDPYELSTSLVVVGGALNFNGSGPLRLDQPLSAQIYNVDLLMPAKRAGLRMAGMLGNLQIQVLDILLRQHQAAMIQPLGKTAPHKAGLPEPEATGEGAVVPAAAPPEPTPGPVETTDS